MKSIKSPKFKVAEKEFSIEIYPEDYRDGSTPHIAVYLNNHNEEKIKVSYTLKHESGAKKVLEEKEFDAWKGRGTDKFLSHGDYKKWAEDHGDVFKVEAEITLHVQEEEGNPEPDWETVPRKSE